MAGHLTEAHKKYIRQHYHSYTHQQLSDMLGVGSKSIVQRFCRKEGLKRTVAEITASRAAALREKYVNTVHPHDDILRREYLNIPVKTLAKQIGKSACYIKKRLGALGLEIPKELAEKRKRDCMYQTGVTPRNKGKKQTEFMTPEQIEKSKATRFKKGQSPHNTKHDGCISIRTDTNKKGITRSYKWIRIKECKWVPLHVYVWEQHHGKVPQGSVIVFYDGDTMNVTIENLRCVSRKELALMNKMAAMPPAVKEVAVLNNRLKEAIHERNDRTATA